MGNSSIPEPESCDLRPSFCSWHINLISKVPLLFFCKCYIFWSFPSLYCSQQVLLIRVEYPGLVSVCCHGALGKCHGWHTPHSWRMKHAASLLTDSPTTSLRESEQLTVRCGQWLDTETQQATCKTRPWPRRESQRRAWSFTNVTAKRALEGKPPSTPAPRPSSQGSSDKQPQAPWSSGTGALAPHHEFPTSSPAAARPPPCSCQTLPHLRHPSPSTGWGTGLKRQGHSKPSFPSRLPVTEQGWQ